MKDALAAIGALFLWTSGAIIVVVLYQHARGRRGLEVDHLRQSLGYASLLVWIVLGLGVASWLASIPFVGAGWLLDHVGH